MGLPRIPGSLIFISALPHLTAHRGKLLSGRPGVGKEVHAASFVRERKIVFEQELFEKAELFRLILVHELFHFVWPRLSNELRRQYGDLVDAELRARARGELGESSSVRKTMLASGSKCRQDYICESFCDTAAWLYSGVAVHSGFRLAVRWKKSRSDWFRQNFERYWELRCS